MNQRRSILIVDDEAALREALAFDFELLDFDVHQAANGIQALKTLENEAIDVVLTDIRMPLMDGVQLLNQIRQRKTEQPVVMFLTGFSDFTLEKAHHLGADAVISKPFERRQLHSVIERALRPPRERWLPSTATDDAAQRSLPRIRQVYPRRDGLRLDDRVHLGRGGFFIPWDDSPQLSLRQKVSFELEAPNLRLEGVGQVLWARTAGNANGASEDRLPGGYGIEILELSLDGLEDLLELLRQHPERAYIPLA